MPEPSVTHSTFVVERSYPQPPERVFAAFAHSHLAYMAIGVNVGEMTAIVAFASTAVAVSLLLRLFQATGRTTLSSDE